MPSVVVPLEDSLDRNFLVNHLHPDTARITIYSTQEFDLAPRLFSGAPPLTARAPR